MRVLLISAVPEFDPACGDVTYSQALLANPPAGVEYESYPEALKKGLLREHYTRQAVFTAWSSKENWVGELSHAALFKSLNYLRRARLLFSERYRFFSVEPGAYDLIHMHVFHGAFLNLPCPLIVSAGCPLQYLYADVRGWSSAKLAIVDQIERSLARCFNINLNSHILPQATRLLTYTNDARDWFASHGVMPYDKIDIVPLFKPSCAETKPVRAPRKILFVAKDFVAKGGRRLLEAFDQVREKMPTAELHIIGSQPLLDTSTAQARGISWQSYVPREQLLAKLVDYDIFAYPTEFDCISYVLLEAMSAGLPIATSDYPSMPEAVDFGRAGKISKVGNASLLAENLLTLLEPQSNEQYSQAALERFETTYSATVVREKLLASYEAALRTWQQASAAPVAV